MAAYGRANTRGDHKRLLSIGSASEFSYLSYVEQCAASEGLERLLKAGTTARVLYTIPTGQNPSGCTTSAERRQKVPPPRFFASDGHQYHFK
jgi:hypothetical protein